MFLGDVLRVRVSAVIHRLYFRGIKSIVNELKETVDWDVHVCIIGLLSNPVKGGKPPNPETPS
jgi:hypothetical protein